MNYVLKELNWHWQYTYCQTINRHIISYTIKIVVAIETPQHKHVISDQEPRQIHFSGHMLFPMHFLYWCPSCSRWRLHNDRWNRSIKKVEIFYAIRINWLFIYCCIWSKSFPFFYNCRSILHSYSRYFLWYAQVWSRCPSPYEDNWKSLEVHIQ